MSRRMRALDDGGRADQSVQMFPVDPLGCSRFTAQLEEAIRSEGPLETDEGHLRFIDRHLEMLGRHLPELVERVATLPTDLECESLIVTGLPSSNGVDDLCVSRIVSGMLARQFDDAWGPIQFLQEKSGDLWSVLMPRDALASSQSGQGRIPFHHHTDFSWQASDWCQPQRVKPRYNILAGILNPAGTCTTYTSVKRVIQDHLRADDVRILSEPWFRIPIPAEMNLAVGHSRPCPILWSDESGRWCLQIRGDVLVPDAKNKVACKALTRLRAGLRFCERSFCLRHGMYALVNNVYGSHARGPITGTQTRLVLRLYVADRSGLPVGTHLLDANDYLYGEDRRAA